MSYLYTIILDFKLWRIYILINYFYSRFDLLFTHTHTLIIDIYLFMGK